MGREIPSLYLRVFSNGTVECHTMSYTGVESDLIKKKTLTGEELDRLKGLVENPELTQVKRRYGLMYWVVDAWMEWDIKVPHGSHTQEIRVLNFAPLEAEEKKQPYPDALVKLGCSIRKLRNDVYADEPSYRAKDCKQALGIE